MPLQQTLYQESVRIHMHVHCGRTQQPCKFILLETRESQLLICLAFAINPNEQLEAKTDPYVCTFVE
jgi:hypothetical protein